LLSKYSTTIDKLIQVPIRVPKAGVREIRSYLFMLYEIEAEVSDEKSSELRISIFYFIVYRILRLVEEKYYFFYFYLRFDQVIFLISKFE
jgi:hypothetical protein